jgi:hypothetical protein
MDFTAVQARLADRVPALRVIEDALSLAALVRAGTLPQQSPAAYVIPGGMVGGEANSAAGAYVQNVREITSVVLSVLTHSAAGRGHSAGVDVILRDILAAICGWGPATSPGVYELVRTTLDSMAAGAVVYRIDFALNDQLRITP